MQIFLTKFLFSCTKKLKSLKFSKDLHFFITCVLSWGILEATHVLTFFIFAFALQILFFLRPWSIDRFENQQIR